MDDLGYKKWFSRGQRKGNADTGDAPIGVMKLIGPQEMKLIGPLEMREVILLQIS